MVLGPLTFMVGKRAALFSRTSGGGLSPLCLITPASKTPWLWMYLKWSLLIAPVWLVELSSAELPLPQATFNRSLKINVGYLTWALFEGGGRQRFLVVQVGATVGTLEAFFRNARWLEREAGEMVGVFFHGKRDRRTLFGLPIFYSNPLRRAFPVGGLFDLGLCPLTHKLAFRHVSWLS